MISRCSAASRRLAPLGPFRACGLDPACAPGSGHLSPAVRICGGTLRFEESLLSVRHDDASDQKGTHIMLIGDRGGVSWQEVTEIEHHQLSVSALPCVSSKGAQE